MEKQLKDYLHLYLGCECETPLGVMLLSSVDLHSEFPCWFRYKHTVNADGYPTINAEVLRKHSLCGRGFFFKQVKPILRPLSSMTEEERNEGLLIFVNTNEAYSVKTKDRVQLGDAARVHFLLSKHFDLFGLIEAGLAIDQTTQPK